MAAQSRAISTIRLHGVRAVPQREIRIHLAPRLPKSPLVAAVANGAADLAADFPTVEAAANAAAAVPADVVAVAPKRKYRPLLPNLPLVVIIKPDAVSI